MGTVSFSTTPGQTATAFGNQRKEDRTQNGILWAFSIASSGNVPTSYSADNGNTWTSASNLPLYQSTTVATMSAFIDLDDYAHVATSSGDTADIAYIRGTPNAARTSYTWSTPIMLAGNGSNSGPYNYPDIVAFRDPANAGGWRGFCVYGYAVNNTGTCYGIPFTISSAGAVTVGNNTAIAATLASSSSTPCYPSIDFNHTGDAKTVAGGAPNIYVSWSAGRAASGYGIRFRKATYSAGSWTWGAEREIDNTRYFTPTYPGAVAFDGTRVVIAGVGSDGALVAHERDAADTTTTQRVVTANAADTLYRGCTTYSSSGDLYYFGQNNNGDGVRRKWNRATAALDAPVVLVPTGPNPNWFSARRGSSGGAVDAVWTQGTASPYTVTSGRIALNSPPNAPTLTSPANNATIDDTIVQQLAWAFSDPDTGDSQSKFDLQYRVQGTSTWTTITQSTPNSYWNAPANTFTQGSTYEWQVRTYDSTGTQGQWSSSSFFTAQAPPATPTITSPTSGSTISASSAQVAWSEPNQDTYQVRVVADDGAGNPVTSSVVWDSGAISQAYVRVQQVPFATNNVTQHVQVRVQYQGLWSAWADARVLVSYTPPASPTLSLIPQQASASLAVVYSQPAPGSGQPAVAYVDIFIDDGPSPTGQASPGLTRRATQLPAQGSWTYYTPRAGWDYTGGRVRVTSVATNGTSTSVTS